MVTQTPATLQFLAGLICPKLPILALSFPNSEDFCTLSHYGKPQRQTRIHSSTVLPAGVSLLFSFVAAWLNLGALINIRGPCRSSLRPLCSFGYLLLGTLTAPWIFGCVFPKSTDLDMLIPKESVLFPKVDSVLPSCPSGPAMQVGRSFSVLWIQWQTRPEIQNTIVDDIQEIRDLTAISVGSRAQTGPGDL